METEEGHPEVASKASGFDVPKLQSLWRLVTSFFPRRMRSEAKICEQSEAFVRAALRLNWNYPDCPRGVLVQSNYNGC
jgi:hypothetical protein